MENKKRTCVVCGSSYAYCPNCSRDAGKPTWMFILCSDTCHDVYEILNKRGFKNITDTEAKKMLSDLNISEKEFYPEIQAQIEEIFKAEETETVEADEVEAIEKDTSKTKTPTKKAKSYSKKTKTVN